MKAQLPLLSVKRATWLFLVLLLVYNRRNCVLLHVHATPAFVAQIKPNGEECVMIRTGSFDPRRSRSLEGSFEVIDDLPTFSIVVLIMDAKEHAVYQSSNERSGSFYVDDISPNTHYWLCLQNHPSRPLQHQASKLSSSSEERIFGYEFDLYYNEDFDDHYHSSELPPEQLVVKVESYSSQWMRLAEHVHKNLKRLQSHHDFMRERELNHRTITEKTFSGILFWTLLETSVVLLLAVGQVVYFQNYLEKKQRPHW